MPGARWPHTLSYLPDVARGLCTLGEREEAFGRRVTPHAEAVHHMVEALRPERPVPEPNPPARVECFPP